MHGGWHGACVPGVTNAEGGSESPVRNSGFGFLSDKIENGGARGLAPCARCGGNGDQREEWFGNGETPAERRIDEVEECCVREARVEVHQLGGVNDRATTYGEEGSWSI